MILIPNKPSSKLPGTCSYNLLNGLIFSNNRVGIQQWFQRFRNSADYFKVICEQVVDFNSKEPQELQFLQFRIVLCAKTCRVRVIPNSKSVAVPLSQFSAHAPSTKNWPVAHLKSMCQLASDRLAAEETKRQIIKRFLTQGSPPGILEQMLAVEAWQTHKQRTESKQKVWWLPIPWHPAWILSNFGRVIRSLFAPEHRAIIQQAFNITDPNSVPVVRLAWKNRLPHSGQMLQRL